MKLTFLGANHEVTGSCTLLSACGKNILIDCGMEQGADMYENCDIPIQPHDIDYVLLTHAHIDHSGKLPLLTSEGFKGRIFTTGATAELCNLMLLDSAHIQDFEARWRNRKATRSGAAPYVPLYTAEDVTKTISLFSPCQYDEQVELCDGISVRFIDAGHLLGSASIEITAIENGVKKVFLFSGDIGNINRPLIRDPQKPLYADYVIIESTYGNRLHSDVHDHISELAEVIAHTLDKGGNLVIPSFAIGRTQELLYYIRIIKERRLIKNHNNFKVYVDSPLAVQATGIYSNKQEMMPYYDSETLSLLQNGINPIHFDGLKLSVTSDDSIKINQDPEPKIIISASGMCDAGRIRHHLKHNLWRPESTVLFVGYQADGTIGRLLVDGIDRVKLFGEEITVRAAIKTISGMSGHADRDMLISWLKNLDNAPEQVFVNHGQDDVCNEFSEHIYDTLHFKATAPYNGAEFDILTNTWISIGNTTKIVRSSHKGAKSNSVFERLQRAGKRLMSVIERNKGGANKDLAKFADQITALCEKWDR